MGQRGRRSSRGRRHRGSKSSRLPKSRLRKTESDSLLVLDYTASVITSGKGFELLSKMGYKPGDGLGKRSDGVPSPVSITVKRGRAGIGAERLFTRTDLTERVPPRAGNFQPTKYPDTSGLVQGSENEGRDILLLRESLGNMALLDPLQPQCRFDPSHRCRHLKALKKHEDKCPARPKVEKGTENKIAPDSRGRESQTYSLYD